MPTVHPRNRVVRLVLLRAASFTMGLGLVLADFACTGRPVSERSSQSPSQSNAPAFAAALPEGVSWQTFDSPQHDFTVLLPAAPVPTPDTVDTPIGEQSVMRFKVQTEDGDFDAGYLTRSTSVLAKLASDQTILKSAGEGTASHLGGHVTTAENLTLDGRPAREVQIVLDADAEHRAQARLIITDSRIYHAIVLLPLNATEAQQAAARRFLDSLRIQPTSTTSAG